MIKRTLTVLASLLASFYLSADVVKMTPLTVFEEGTNETLRAAKDYTDAHSGGGGSCGVDTNAVIDIANATIATNATITTLTSDFSTLTSTVSRLESTKADEFTEWVCNPPTINGFPVRIDENMDVYWWTNDAGNDGSGEVNSDKTEFVSDHTPIVTATRKRVLRTGDAATTNDLTAAISTNNPAFVSAVQSISPPSPPSLRLYDAVRDCYWIGRMVNGIINWEVEE